MKLPVLYRYIIPYRAALAICVLLMIAECLVLLINPWLAGQFTASLLNTSSTNSFTYQEILIIWLFVLAVQAVLNFANQYISSFTGEKILANLKMHLYGHIQSLPLSYFHGKKRGEISSILTYEVDIISYFLTSNLLPAVPQLVTVCGAIIIIFFIDYVIATIILLLTPAFYLLLKILARGIRPVARKMLDEYANILAMIEENLQLMPVIKSFTREKYESNRFKLRSENLLHLAGKYLKIQSLLSPLVNFLGAVLILILLWISSMRFESGQIIFPDLVSLLFYGLLLARATSSLADFYGQAQRADSAAERVVEVLSVHPEPVNNNGRELNRIQNEIKFINVFYSYPDRDNVLTGINLAIKAGETVALTGKNGAGKSTILYLLQRFADPDQGEILIDGINIIDINTLNLRNLVGIVPQHVFLLNGSVRENITYGIPGASQSAIEKAARESHALEFIRNLSDGYDTQIGDEGVKLSGGQKQRIALARALLKDPAILALDEATAMFDPEGEKSFIHECHEILHQRTVILITHRPASLAIADRVLRLEDGKIYAS